MVDAIATARSPKPAMRRGRRTVLAGVSVQSEVVPCFIDAPYASMPKAPLWAPAQSPLFVSAWLEASRPDAFMASLIADGEAVLSIVLEVESRGPISIARLIGGTHANANFPVVSREWLPKADRAALVALTRAIHAARPDIDALVMERLLPTLGGFANPLLLLPNTTHENPSLAVDLSEGFGKVMSGRSGKHKRKKQRNRMHFYETVGGYRRLEAATAPDVEAMLDAFFVMKAARFREAGIRDVFAPPAVRAAMKRIFVGALAYDPKPFVLHGLEVGGTLRAVTGSSLRGSGIVCEFGAITLDEVTRASPGEFLFHENIREAADSGLTLYDFSVGDEVYKRIWCDVESWLADVHVPLTVAGHAFVAARTPVKALRTAVKRDDRLRGLYRSLRKRISGQTQG